MYSLAENVSFEPVEDGGFLVNAESGKIFSLNRTGVIIVNGIVAGKKMDEIADQIYREYCAKKETIEKDIHRYLKLLLDNRHIEEI